jgi:hypothetical protein
MRYISVNIVVYLIIVNRKTLIDVYTNYQEFSANVDD